MELLLLNLNMMKVNKFVILILIVIIQGCSKKGKVDLGNGYIYDTDPVISGDYAIFGPYENTYAVSGDVRKFKYNSVFILAVQKPRDTILEAIDDRRKITYKEQEKIFEQSSIRHYWIIDKMNDSIYGPLKKEEYLKKREELKVPKELELEEVK